MNERDLIGLGFLAVFAQLDRIEAKVDRLLRMETTEMADLTRITDEVTQNTDVVQSAIALLGQLADEIRNAGTDQTALNSLADTLDANSASLAAAVAANTPAAPAPAPPAEPPAEPTP